MFIFGGMMFDQDPRLWLHNDVAQPVLDPRDPEALRKSFPSTRQERIACEISRKL